MIHWRELPAADLDRKLIKKKNYDEKCVFRARGSIALEALELSSSVDKTTGSREIYRLHFRVAQGAF